MASRSWALLFLALLLLGIVAMYFIFWRTRTPATEGYGSGFFGVGEPITLRSVRENLEVHRSLETIRLLGVKRLREWTSMGALLIDQATLNQTFKQTLNLVVSEMSRTNVTILGMSHDFPAWMTGIENDSQAVPRRDTRSGSNYMRFLQIYRESWKTLSAAFPNITMWEIGNEFNTDLFLHPQKSDETVRDFPEFSSQEKAEIATDLLYYGSLGIHEGNPKAKTVLGGLAPYPSISEIADFLRLIYENIKSGRWPSEDPDDCFQVACWHPYLSDKPPTIADWVNPNRAVYEVMKCHGDGDKRVVFSEFGFSDSNISSENVSRYLLDAFQLARVNLPWLDTIYWFRLIEPYPETVGPINPPGYGLTNHDWTLKKVAHTYRSLIGVETGFQYVDTLWAGYAFYETLDPQACDHERIRADTNYLTAKILLAAHRKTEKAQKTLKWLSGYVHDRWKLLFGEEPRNPSVLVQYRGTSHALYKTLPFSMTSMMNGFLLFFI